MESFRYSRNVYGQSALEGISLELKWVFIAAAELPIVTHLLYRLLRGRRPNNKPRPSP